MILRILPTLAALISFVLFLLHRRRFAGTTAIVIRLTWAALQNAIGISSLGIRLPLWLRGDPKDIVLLWIIIPFILTGILMMYLNGKSRREFVDKKSARRQNIMEIAFFIILVVIAILPIVYLEMFIRNNPHWGPYVPIIVVIFLVIVSICIVILFDAANRVISQKFKKKK
jgi:hypothetical protein